MRSFTASDDVTLAVEEGKVVVSPAVSRSGHATMGYEPYDGSKLCYGVSEGFKKELEIQGVGYRAQMQGNVLKLNLACPTMWTMQLRQM